jgi:hypothetical protein
MKAALTPPDSDLRGLPFMPLDVVRLLDSDLFALSTGDEFKAAVALWCKCWLQLPAASLPNDDRILAALAGFGRDVKGWAKVKAMAMRGFVLCDDGRWYHEVIAQKAIEAWGHRLKQRSKSAAVNAKRWNKSSNGEPCGEPICDPRGDAYGDPRGDATRDRKGQGEGYITPIPPAQTPGACPPKAASAVSLPAWLATIKAKGEQPIPETDPVFDYAEQAGIPMDMLRLCWVEFRSRYSEPNAKRYKDWRSVYRKAVRGNWLKLWFSTADGYMLTTVGQQAQRTFDAKQGVPA